MAVFGQLNASLVVQQMQQKLSALLEAFEDCDNAYQWLSAYAAGDLEEAPLSFDAGDAQAILNAFADVHDLYQTAQGTTGFPTAELPYNFLASMRVVMGPR